VNTGAQCSMVVSGLGGCGDVGVSVLNGSSAVISGHADKCNVGVECGDNSFLEIHDMRVTDCTTVDVRRSGIGAVISGSTFANIGTFNPPSGYLDATGGMTSASTSIVPLLATGNSGAWNPVSVANGAQTSVSFTVANAALGQVVTCSPNIVLQGLRLWGEVTASNTVTLYLSNNTGGAVDLGAMTVTVKCLPL
jgi:hypothetical protein